ncbi:hypothetical protein [Nocardia yamanashiensis]|uniref:hypothetical protein n=1 Tax=Nocardia yamanashiensis TaxID=209247 RepID=UPI000B1F7E88|nr:hypothetical protein [Nocardia yamanashiensis]
MSYYPAPTAPPVRRIPKVWLTFLIATTGLFGLCCLGVLWGFAAKGGNDFDVLLYGGGGIVVLGIAWLALAITGIAAYRRFVLATIVPAMLVMTAALVIMGIPGKVGWALTKPALERAAATCTKTDHAGRIGLYTFNYVRPEGDGGCSFTLDGALLGPDGYALFPGTPPQSAKAGAGAGTNYSHYDGNWFTFDNFVQSWA